MYQDTLHQLSSEQVAFLNRGPSYVPPCQMHILTLIPTPTTPLIPMKKLLYQQMTSLTGQLHSVYSKYRVDLGWSSNFSGQIATLASQLFTSESAAPPTTATAAIAAAAAATAPLQPSLAPFISEPILKRALHEKQLVQSIRNQLNQQQLILCRTADNQNTYYLGSRSRFNFKAKEHLTTSDCYELIGSIEPINTEATTTVQGPQQQPHLNKFILSLRQMLKKLLDRNLITERHQILTRFEQTVNFRLPYIYFLPEMNSDGTHELRPKISSHGRFRSSMEVLGKQLEEILRPLYEQISQSIRIDNGGDFIEKLRLFSGAHGLLRPTTRFVTFEIENLYTHLSHADLFNGVNRLLHHTLIYQRHHQGVTNEGIEELVKFFLDNQLFTYDEKVYRYVKGCPLDIPLSRLLFNIYLHHWHYTLLRPIRVADELFGLYHSTGFLTWNQPIEQISQVLTEINRSFDSPIRLVTSIDTNVNFLNCSIENRSGRLYTRVYHEPSAQSFLLPYVCQHPRLYHRKWFRFALVRAGLYCTQVEDFHDEQLHIELAFLANGYSLHFVEYHIRQFHALMNINFPEPRFDQYYYNLLRPQFYRYHTAQKQRANEQKKLEANGKLIHFEYLYDWGKRWKYNEEFMKKWIANLEKDPVFKKYGLKFKLHSKHCYPSNLLLTYSQQ